MSESRIQAVDHVCLEGRPEDRDEILWFYGELAGLARRDAGSGATLRFRSAQIELRIKLVAAPMVEPVVRRVTIAVPSLTVAEEMLTDRGLRFEWVHGFAWTDRRLVVPDPTGYRVEWGSCPGGDGWAKYEKAG